MYNKLKKLSFIATVSIIMMSCSSDIVESDSVKSLRMNAVLEQFAPNSPTSRTSDNGYATSFSPNDKVGIFAITSDGKISTDCNNLCMTFDGTEWGGNTIWGIEGAKYHAYYPYRDGISASSPADVFNLWNATSDQSTHEKYAANDLLTSDLETASNGTLNFSFKHQMSMIEVTLPEECEGNVIFAVNGEQVKMWNIGSKVYRLLTPLAGKAEIYGSFTAKGKTVSYTKDDLYLIRGTYYRLSVGYEPELEQYVVLELNGFGNDVNIDKSVEFTLEATPSVRFPAEPTAAEKLIVTSNGSWQATCSATWIKLSDQSGTGNSTISVTADKNTNTVERTTTITLKGTNSNKTVTVLVTQDAGGTTDINLGGFGTDQDIDGKGYVTTINKQSVDVDATKNTASVTVTSNEKWTVTSNKSWCTVSPSSGTGNGSFTITVAENTTTSKRDATITVKGSSSGITQTVTVSQEAGGSTTIDVNGFGSDQNIDGKGYTLTVDTQTLTVSNQSTASTITVTSNDNWTASSNYSWCTVSPSSGSGNGSITVRVTSNTTTNRRSATITVKGSQSGKTATVTVNQEAGGQTVIDINGFGGDTNIDKK